MYGMRQLLFLPWNEVSDVNQCLRFAKNYPCYISFPFLVHRLQADGDLIIHPTPVPKILDDHSFDFCA